MAILILFLVSCASKETIPFADKEIKEKYHADELKKYFEGLYDLEHPGFSYLISKNGKIIVSGGVGAANIEEKTPNNTKTIFRVASITKQFTAVSILQLAESGKLSVNDSLAKYYPNLPNAEKITIRNLLNHTSGMWEQENDDQFPFPIDELVSEQEHLSYIQKNGVFFEPGEKWRYCSNGYFVLGLIVEKVSGLSLASYMEKNIFAPLGMKNTGLYDASVKNDHSAIGYGVTEDKPYKEINVNMATYNGAAALDSTVEDLFIWNEALHNGKLINEASYKEAITPYEFTNGFIPFVGYGFGLGIEPVGGHNTIGHPGQMKGFHSDILRLPDDDINIILLSNMNNYQFKVKWRFSEKIINIMFQE